MGEDKVVVTRSDRPGWWETEEQQEKKRQYDRDSLKEFMDSFVVKDIAGRSHGLSDGQKEEFMMVMEAKKTGYELAIFKGRRRSRLVMKKVYDSMSGVIASGGSVVREEVWIKIGNGRAMTRKFEEQWLKSKNKR